MDLSVKLKVVLGAAGVLLVGLLSMLVIYGALRTAQKAMHEVAEVEEPTSAAAYEMEINVIGAGLGVLKYLDTGDPQYRDRVEKGEADFVRFKARYDELAETSVGKELGNKVSALFGEFVQLGNVMMDGRDERETLFRAIAENFEVIDRILDEEIQENLDEAGPDGQEKVIEAAAMEGDIAEVGVWLGNYLRVATPAYRERIFDNARDFRVHLAEFKNLRLSETERQRTERLEKIFSRTFSMIQKDLALHDELQAQVRRFLVLREQMDYVLDDEIQTLTMKDLEVSKRMAEEAHVNVIWSISLLLPVFLLLGLGTARVLIRDYTQRKQAEEAIKESEERFRSVTQSASEAIIIADGKGEIISWNDGARITFGYVEQEVLGKAFTVLMPERYREAHRMGLERVGSTGETRVIGRTIDLFGLRKDSSEFPLELSLSSWETEKGRFYAGIARDITKRKQAEEHLQKSKQAAEEASRLKTIFVSFAAHQLRTPLTGIRWHLELASMVPQIPEEAATHIQGADESVGQLIRMVNYLLSILRLESGKISFSIQETNLETETREALDELEYQIQEKALNVSVIRPDESLSITTDRGLLRQVISNLASNAVKYSRPNGNISIRIRENGASMLWSIQDNGIGIPKRDQVQLFDKFFRASNVTSIETEGNGLGLCISRLILEKLGGKMSFESEENKGSIFTLAIPKKRMGRIHESTS